MPGPAERSGVHQGPALPPRLTPFHPPHCGEHMEICIVLFIVFYLLQFLFIYFRNLEFLYILYLEIYL